MDSIRDQYFTEKRYVTHGIIRAKRNYKKIPTFYLLLPKACRRARPSMKDKVLQQQEWESLTRNYDKASRHGHISRQLDQYPLPSKMEGPVIKHRLYATVTSVPYCEQITVQRRLSEIAVTDKDKH